MKIGELGERTGVDGATIRYYEREGLLPQARRSPNGYRQYGARHAERLAFIRHCRALDMPLAEIRTLLALAKSPGVSCARVNGLIDDQLARLHARLESMKALERKLQALRKRCNTPGAREQCGILEDLVAAAHGEHCACHPGPRARR
ncbi:MAG TPA: Cd(II)/Pb(II)-responsive transcriptional regulator [Usitatibacter sp.]|nr:Cd(II)/Pb(II)-responsive transcriptional regulator [Usitatibacter sp.]